MIRRQFPGARPARRLATSHFLLPAEARRGAIATAAAAPGVDEQGVLALPGGALRRVLRVESTTLESRTVEEQDHLAAALAALVNALTPGQLLQILVISRPVEARQILPPIFATLRPTAPALGEFAQAWQTWIVRQLERTHVPDLAYYVVVAPMTQRALGLTALRPRPSEDTARRGLQQAVDEVLRHLKIMGLGARLLGCAEVQALLWEAFHLGGAPCPPSDLLTDTPAPAVQANPRARRSGCLRSLARRLDPVRLIPAARVAAATTRGTAPGPGFFAQVSAVRAEEAVDGLELDGQQTRSLFLLAPPELTSPGWLDPLISLDVPYRLSLHIEGLDRAAERKRLKRRRRAMNVVALADRKGLGYADVDLESAEAEAMQQARELLDPRAGIARLGLYLTLVAPDAAHLATYTDRAINTLTTHMSAEAGRGIGLQLPLWQSTLPLGVDAAGRRYRLRSETIGNALPFLSHNPGSRHGYPLGFTRTGHQLVLFDPADPGHRNSLVTTFGSTGSGKTFMTLKMVLFTLLTGGRVTIVDRSAHYEPLRAVAGGVEVRFAGPQPPALNIWERSGAELASKINFVADAHEILLVNPGEQLSPLQRSAIEEGIRAVYERHTDVSAPCEHELVDWLEGQAAAAVESEERQLYKNLAASLYPYVRNGRFAPIVDRPTTVDLDAPLVLFNIEGLSATLHAFVMFAIAEVVDRRARRRAGPPRGGQVRELLVIDEGWFLIKYGRASAWIEEIARRGRHWGLFLMFVTQQLSDLLNDATATTLFNAASMTLIFRLRDEGGNAGGGSSVQRLCASLGLTREEALTVQRLETVRQEYAGLFLIRDTKEASVALRGEVQVIAHPLEYWLFTNDTQHGDLAKRERMVAACGGDVWRAVKLLAAGREPEEITLDDVHGASPQDASTACSGAAPPVDAREERPAWAAG